MMVAGFLLVDEHNVFPGLVALAPTVGTALVLLSVADGETRLSRLLSAPFLRGTGRLSYSLYLWHWPIIIFGKIQADLYGLPQPAGAVAGGLVSLLLAWAAYFGVEKPLRKRGPGRSGRLATIAGGFAVVALGCIFIVVRRAPVDPHHRFDPPAFSGMLFDAGRAADPGMGAAVRYSDVHFPPVPARPENSWRTGGVIQIHGGARPKVVVLGSSHALMYSRLIDDLCRERNLTAAFLGVDAVTPAFFETTVNRNFASPQEAHEFDEARRKWLREWRPEIVFVIDRWDARVGTAQDFDRRLRSFLREVCPLAGRVYFVAQAPAMKLSRSLNLRAFVTWSLGAQEDLPRLLPDAGEAQRKLSVAIAEAAVPDFPNLRVLRADRPFYNEDNSVRYAAGRKFFYIDGDHLTDDGAEEVRSLLAKAIADAQAGAVPPK
jgi:hypothetical protein